MVYADCQVYEAQWKDGKKESQDDMVYLDDKREGQG